MRNRVVAFSLLLAVARASSLSAAAQGGTAYHTAAGVAVRH